MTVETSSDDTVSSSVKSENLREIWKILDEDVGDDDNNNDDTNRMKPTRDTYGPGLVVTGTKPPGSVSSSDKKTAAASGKSTPVTSRRAGGVGVGVTTTISQRKPVVASKIRNYNVKD